MSTYIIIMEGGGGKCIGESRNINIYLITCKRKETKFSLFWYCRTLNGQTEITLPTSVGRKRYQYLQRVRPVPYATPIRWYCSPYSWNHWVNFWIISDFLVTIWMYKDRNFSAIKTHKTILKSYSGMCQIH